MNVLRSKEKSLSRTLLCSFFGHKLVIKRNITPYFSEFECTVCKLELTNTANGEKISLTPHLKEVNETLFNFHNRRHNSIV